MEFDDVDILPLNLDWEDPMPKEIVAGGESRIVEETLSDKQSESMARKAGNGKYQTERPSRKPR